MIVSFPFVSGDLVHRVLYFSILTNSFLQANICQNLPDTIVYARGINAEQDRTLRDLEF